MSISFTNRVQACVISQHFSAALPVLSHPITAIDTNLSDLTYNDNLVYHYTGGIALAALKRWSEAEEFFETCVSGPGQAPAAIQMEALKKLVLVQLISRGKVSCLSWTSFNPCSWPSMQTINPPKYTHPNLLRLFKSTPYMTLVNSYPQQTEQMRALVEKERQLFVAVCYYSSQRRVTQVGTQG
jgi:COP9 signalosome complex subunit 3